MCGIFAGMEIGMKHFFRRKSSCQVAKDRLKILLISDRVNCSPEMMELIKTDIAKVISKYMKIDSEKMEIQINTKGSKAGRAGKPSLCATIPIVDVNNAQELVLRQYCPETIGRSD